MASADTNTRKDPYGGPPENRVRLLTELLPWMREAVGDDFVIAVRLGGNMPALADGIRLAQLVEQAGVDLLSVSHGNTAPAKAPDGYEGSDISYLAAQAKQIVSVPVIGVGDVRTKEDAEYLLAGAKLDLVAVGRGMLANENWANEALRGEKINECLDCPRCSWFTDHTKCPARLKG